MIITFDIETIPTIDQSVMAEISAKVDEKIEVPGNYSKPETIAKWMTETRPRLVAAKVAEKIAETSLDGAYGAICCIGYKINDDEPVAITAPARSDEYDMLCSFYNRLESAFNLSNRDFKVTVVGHNVVNFDLRFLLHRSIIFGVKPPSFMPFNAKPWEIDRVYDTSTQWAGVGNRVSLSKLCKVFDLEPKGAELGEHFDGSMVWDAYQRGEIDKIAMYCKGDVERTYQIYKRMTFSEDK